MSVATIEGVPGVQPVIELGHGDPIVWDDIACDVHDVESAVGRERSIDRWQVGTLSLTISNVSGRYDVGNDAAATLRPGLQVRVGVIVDGAPIKRLFHGWIDACSPRYDPELHDVVDVEAIDGKGFYGKADVRTAVPPIPQQTASDRVLLVLAEVACPPVSYDVPPTSTAVLPSDLGQRAVDLLDLTADSIGGVMYADANGVLSMRPAPWAMQHTGVPPDGTIGNVEPTDVCPSGWELSWQLSDIATRVLVGRSSQAPVVMNNASGQALYGVETFSRSDLISVDDGALGLIAERLLAVLSPEFMPNVGAVTIELATSSAARDLAIGVDPTVPTRYRCRLERMGRLVFDRTFLVTGVRHSLNAESWTTRIALDDNAPWVSDDSFWDVSGWDEGDWV